MHRRDFITLLGGAAAAWPLVARAQQDSRMRRIAVLDGLAGTERDPASQANLAAFRETLTKLGWIEGRNLRIDHRAGAGNLDRIRAAAAELVGFAPEAPLQRLCSIIWIADDQVPRTSILSVTNNEHRFGQPRFRHSRTRAGGALWRL
jgi:putative ABC transport system substrate-binding protein